MVAQKTMRGEGGVGLEMSRGRLDARDQRRPIGDKDEDEDGSDQCAIGTRLDLHRVADLIVDRADKHFKKWFGFLTG